MRPFKLIGLSLACLALAFGATAQAAPTIRLTSGGSSLTWSSGSSIAAADSSGWSLGDWLVDMSPASGTPRLDLLSGQFISNAAGTYLDVELSDTDFSLGGLSAIVNFFGNIAGATSGTATWWLYADDANVQFSRATLVGNGSTIESGAFSGRFASDVMIDGTFSMTLLVRINHGNGANRTDFSFAAVAQQVPEPATVLLLAIGLLAVAIVGRRTRRS